MLLDGGMSQCNGVLQATWMQLQRCSQEMPVKDCTLPDRHLEMQTRAYVETLCTKETSVKNGVHAQHSQRKHQIAPWCNDSLRLPFAKVLSAFHGNYCGKVPTHLIICKDAASRSCVRSLPTEHESQGMPLMLHQAPGHRALSVQRKVRPQLPMSPTQD